MVVSRQDSGRILQKRRTRLAIVVAAASLLAQGRRPTVAEAADAALVSRATAYRYFPSQGALLLEAALQSTHPEIAPALADAPADDVNARFDVVCTAMFERVIEAEPQMRQMLQFTQQEWLDNSDVVKPRLRQGRRLEWIEQALEPLRGRLDKNDFERLVNGLAMTVGVEAYIALRDVCGLDNQAAIATMRWAGHALITAAKRPTEIT